MSYADVAYFALAQKILDRNPGLTPQEMELGLSPDDIGGVSIAGHTVIEPSAERTGTGMLAGLSDTRRYWASHFPLLTTKRVFFRGVKEELLWMLKGDTNIRALLEKNIHIWSEWPHAAYCKARRAEGLSEPSLAEFEAMVLKDEDFAKAHGDLGPVYGKQWRKWQVGDKTVDQLQDIIDILRSDMPYSRRLLMSGWNIGDIPDMALAPCHTLYQFYVIGRTLHLTLLQRSGDVFLGIPFNIASATLLLKMVAQVTGLHAGSMTHCIVIPHIYVNHQDQMAEQLARDPMKHGCPTVALNPDIREIDDFKSEDIVLDGYVSESGISAKVAV